jgi:hypothetical protein
MRVFFTRTSTFSSRRRWNPGAGSHHHWHGGFGGGLSIGLIGYDGGGDCYYVRRSVFVPGIGIVGKRELVCG